MSVPDTVPAAAPDPDRSDAAAVPRSIAEVARVGGRVLDAVEEVVIGKRPALELILMALLADGHVLIDDVPGVAKTLLARSFAQVLGMSFSRVQMTPDVLPTDLSGALVLDAERALVFRPGPIFANVVLADEINRATPKAQSALLEAMEERQVTIDGTSYPLERPFLVIATQNPIEFEGTYPLPEAQLDRFLIRTSVGYPTGDDEWEMVSRRLGRRRDEVVLAPVVDRTELLALQRAVEEVHVSEAIGRYAVAIVQATRSSAPLAMGSSPRGTLALVKLARARAALAGRDFAVPDDVKQVAIHALGHRVLLQPEAWVRRVDPQGIIAAIVAAVPVPSAAEVLRPQA